MIELFVAGSIARTGAVLVDVNKTGASYYFQRLRQLIYEHSQHLEIFAGEVKVNESYFGKRSKSWVREVKFPYSVFLIRCGKVFIVIIPDD